MQEFASVTQDTKIAREIMNRAGLQFTFKGSPKSKKEAVFLKIDDEDPQLDSNRYWKPCYVEHRQDVVFGTTGKKIGVGVPGTEGDITGGADLKEEATGGED